LFVAENGHDNGCSGRRELTARPLCRVGADRWSTP
jgi:hypothetical protein